MTMAAKKTPTAADAPKASYTVIAPLSHDQFDYAIGETVELTEAEAKPLLGLAVEETKTDADAQTD